MGIEVYSDLTFPEAMRAGSNFNPRLREIHERMTEFMCLIDVQHIGYDGQRKQGQLVVHRELAEPFKGIFTGLIELNYPIEVVLPMSCFGWSDAQAMAVNNTSVYRPSFIGDPARRKASEHTRGSALDLNPLDNPLINPDHTIEPKEAIGRMPRSDAKIYHNLAVIKLLDEAGLEYGGYWDDRRHPTDYYGGDSGLIVSDRHHFELRPVAAGQLETPPTIWQPTS